MSSDFASMAPSTPPLPDASHYEEEYDNYRKFSSGSGHLKVQMADIQQDESSDDDFGNFTSCSTLKSDDVNHTEHPDGVLRIQITCNTTSEETNLHPYAGNCNCLKCSQGDSASQDSGLCTSSQQSETSPLPSSDPKFLVSSNELDCESLNQTHSKDTVDPELSDQSSSTTGQASDLPDHIPDLELPQLSDEENSYLSKDCDSNSVQDFEWTETDDIPVPVSSLSMDSEEHKQVKNVFQKNGVCFQVQKECCDSEPGSEGTDFNVPKLKSKGGMNTSADVTSAIEKDDSFDDFQQAIDVSKFKVYSDAGSSLEGKFSSQLPVVPENDDFCSIETIKAIEHDDSFADFESAVCDFGNVSQDCKESALEKCQEVKDDDDDDFADFENASFMSAAEPEDLNAIPDASSSKVEPIDMKTAQAEGGSPLVLLQAAFPAVSTESPGDVETGASLQEQEHHVKLWKMLQDLDQAPCLNYQWGNSLTCQYLLQSLNIDSRNIEIIPPAQFDWTSSGLVNPLDPNQASSALLDLEYFATISVKSSAVKTSSSLEEEFLGEIPSEPVNNKSPLLEQLLSSTVSTLPSISSSKRPSALSKEASRMLDQLPDLSFMQAKVLMFPIRSQTET